MKNSDFTFKVEDKDFVSSSKNCHPWKHCVAVAKKSEGVAVRDTKDVTGKTLFFTNEEWNAFIGGVKNGEF